MGVASHAGGSRGQVRGLHPPARHDEGSTAGQPRKLQCINAQAVRGLSRALGGLALVVSSGSAVIAEVPGRNGSQFTCRSLPVSGGFARQQVRPRSGLPRTPFGASSASGYPMQDVGR